jgi:phosphomannomutase
MVSVSGVRGLLGDDMNPEVAARFAAAYATWLGGTRVVIGRDTRASGPALSMAATAALRFLGVDVVDVGIASTPTVELMVGRLGCDGGIIITASHNNEKWNALKLLDGSGEFIDSAAVAGIREHVEADEGLYIAPGLYGSYETYGGADRDHVDRILGLDCVDREAIAGAKINAAIDCVNGAGSRIVPLLLGELGVETTKLYTDVDAPFPHDPEPRPSSLTELSALVSESGADIGFACDPDADRLVLVDGSGRVLSEELTLSLAADFVLGVEKGPVVANLSTTRRIDDVAARHGVEAHRSKVGEANVIEVMKEKGAVIGGEGNGGVIFPKVHRGRDAMTGIALVLQYIASSGKSVGELAASLPDYSVIKEKIAFDGDFDALSAKLTEIFPGTVNGLDGIRIDMDKGWVHVRRSNTEPVVRIIAEADSPETAEELATQASAAAASVQ